MVKLQLFRVKVYPPEQGSLFAAEFVPQLALVDTIGRKPAAELRTGYTWHVGNISKLDAFGLYFALGRTTRSTIEMYDETTGNFLEAEFPAAPYTHVLCDTALEVLGIAPKSQLAPTVPGIARQLEKLLNIGAADTTGATFEINEINDPEEFIQQLRAAYAVSRFALTFSLPNPFDANKDFVEPMERLLRDSRGRQGRTTLKGRDLNSSVLEELTRSAAATGNQAEATIKRSKGAKPVKRHLKGDVAAVSEKEIGTEQERRGVLHSIRSLYARVRGSANSN